MKILVVSLLRIGDVILITPVLRGLKLKYPTAEIHLLINRESESIAPLLPEVDQIWYFDRQLIQESLGEADLSLAEGFLRARELIHNLKGQKFDYALNLTHTKLSGWLTGMLECEVRAGLSILENRTPAISSHWFRYLNEYSAITGSDSFHYADIFYFGSGLEGSTPAFCLKETEKGRAEAATWISERPTILIQTRTSDDKKNWPLNSFLEMVKLLSILRPGYEFILLGAPHEAEGLEPLACQLRQAEIPVQLAICSLEGAFSLLKRARLLITGDTSIKHMASAADCRTLELSIGSSQFQKTGAFNPHNIIIQSRQACAPCPHNSPCSRQTHACAEQIAPEPVALIASKLLDRDMAQIRVTAEEYADQISVYKTNWSESGLWQAISMAGKFSKSDVAKMIARVGWQLLISGEYQQPLAQFGSHSLRLLSLLKSTFPSRSRWDWLQVFGELETDLEKVEAGFAQGVPAYMTDGTIDFQKIKALRDTHKESHLRTQIELKIVRTLRLET